MHCQNCGESLEPNAKFCPNCGQPVQREATAAEVEPVYAEPAQEPAAALVQGSAASHSVQAYVRADYDPARHGRPLAGIGLPGQPAAAVQPGSQQGAAGQAAASQPAAGQPVIAAPRSAPAPAGSIVFAIINILCCGFGVSTVLGIIALVFSIVSTSELVPEESRRKIKTANTLNWIGLAFIVLQVLVMVIVILSSLIAFRDNGINFTY